MLHKHAFLYMTSLSVDKHLVIAEKIGLCIEMDGYCQIISQDVQPTDNPQNSMSVYFITFNQKYFSSVFWSLGAFFCLLTFFSLQ